MSDFSTNIYDPRTNKLSYIPPGPTVNSYLDYMAQRGKAVDLTNPKSPYYTEEMAEILRREYGQTRNQISETEAKHNLKTVFDLSGDESEKAFKALRGKLGQENGMGQSISEFSKNLKKAYDASHLQQKLGELYFNLLAFENAPGFMRADKNKTLAEIERLEALMPKDYDGAFVQTAANALISLFPQMEARWRKALPVAILTAGTTAAMGAVTGPGAMAFAGGGFLAGLTTGSVEAGAEIMSGLKYRELLNLKAADGTSLKPAAMKAIALSTGALQALLEVPSQLSGLRFIPGISGVMSRNSQQIVKSATAKFLNSASTKSSLRALANVVEHGGSEGIEEFTQGLADMLANYVATETINKAVQSGEKIEFSAQKELHQAMYEGIIGAVVGGVSAGAGQVLVSAVDRHGPKYDAGQVAERIGVTESEVAPFRVREAESETIVKKHRYINNERTKNFNRLGSFKPDAGTVNSVNTPYLQRIVAGAKEKQAMVAELLRKEKELLSQVSREALGEQGKHSFDQEVADMAFIAPDGSLKKNDPKLFSTTYTNDSMNEVHGGHRDIPGVSHNTVFLSRDEIAGYMGLDSTHPEVMSLYNEMKKRAEDGKFSITIVQPSFEFSIETIGKNENMGVMSMNFIERNEGKWFSKDKIAFEEETAVEGEAKPKGPDNAIYLIKLYDQFVAEKLEEGYTVEQATDMYNKKAEIDNKLLSGEYAVHPAFRYFLKDPKTGKIVQMNESVRKMRESRVNKQINKEAFEDTFGKIEPTAEEALRNADYRNLEPEDRPNKYSIKTQDAAEYSANLTEIMRQSRKHKMKLMEEEKVMVDGKPTFNKKLNTVSPESYKGMEHVIDRQRLVNKIQRKALREDVFFSDARKQSKDLLNGFDRIKEYMYFRQARSLNMTKFPDSIRQEMSKLLGHEYGKEDYETMRSILLYIEAKNLSEEQVETFINYKKAKYWYEKAMAITDEQKVIAEKVEKRMSEMLADARSNNVVDWEVENYVPHYWKQTVDETKPRRYKHSSPSFSPFTTHNIKRKNETYFDGLRKNLDFMYRDPLGDLFAYERDMQASMAAKDMIEAGMMIRDINGNPFFSRKKLENYAEIKHDAFVVDTPVPDMPHHTSYANDSFHWRKVGDGPNDKMLFMEDKLYAPAEVAKWIDNAFGESILDNTDLGRGITVFNAARKSVRLLMSLFHAMSYSWQWYAGVQGNKFKREAGGLNPIKAYRYGLRSLALRDEDVQLLTESGLTYDMNNDYVLDSNAKKFIGNLKGPFKIVQPLLRVTDAYNNWLFNRFGSGLKISAALVELNHLREKYGWMDQDELARAAAQHVNNDFGGLDLRRMGRNQTVQNIFKLLIMAPDWNESNIRTMTSLAGRFDPLGQGANKAISGRNPLVKELAKRMWFGGAMKLVALNLVSNFLMSVVESGFDEWEDVLDNMVDNYEVAWRSGNLNWMKTDITPIYEALGINRQDEKRRYYNFGRHWGDFLKWTTDLPGTAWAKKSFLVSDIMTLSTGAVFGAMELTTISDMISAINSGDTAGIYMKWGGARDAESKWELFPSFVIYSIMNMAPAQAEHILDFAMGRQEWLDLILNVSGLGVSKGSVTYW